MPLTHPVVSAAFLPAAGSRDRGVCEASTRRACLQQQGLEVRLSSSLFTFVPPLASILCRTFVCLLPVDSIVCSCIVPRSARLFCCSSLRSHFPPFSHFCRDPGSRCLLSVVWCPLCLFLSNPQGWHICPCFSVVVRVAFSNTCLAFRSSSLRSSSLCSFCSFFPPFSFPDQVFCRSLSLGVHGRATLQRVTSCDAFVILFSFSPHVSESSKRISRRCISRRRPHASFS